MQFSRAGIQKSSRLDSTWFACALLSTFCKFWFTFAEISCWSGEITVPTIVTQSIYDSCLTCARTTSASQEENLDLRHWQLRQRSHTRLEEVNMLLHNVLALAEHVTKQHKEVVPLTANEALSGILGSVSLCCWIFLLVPQLVENYKNQSAEAISLAFVVVWFLGDLANLLGAVWAGLVPVIIAIACYFCFSDGVLISQILYYGIRNKRREGQSLLGSVKDLVIETETGTERHTRSSVDSTNDLERQSTAESEPLLSRKHSRAESFHTFTIPGSADAKVVRDQAKRRRSSAGSKNLDVTTDEQNRARRKSSSTAAASGAHDNLPKISEESASVQAESTKPSRSKVVSNILSIFGVVLVGTIGWFVAYQTGTWKPSPPPLPHAPTPEDDLADPNPAGAQFLGYISAVLYLTARLPQIYKNYREQSCEGLSLLFFILSLMGNGTYGGGILAHSLESNYVMKNVPWLIGSLGTMVEDVVVFWQFRLYKAGVQTNEHAILDDDVVEGPSTGR